LIVPIAHAHQTKFDDAIFCPDAQKRSGRAAP
jgi:hypothetical protein